jgi:hypothetical protein
MTSLVPVIQGRPSTISKNGCTLFVSVHDQFYIQEYKRLKQQILDCHPDRRWFTNATIRKSVGGTGRGTTIGKIKPRTVPNGGVVNKPLKPQSAEAFMRAQQLLDQFVKKEIAYYASIGLTPPEV